MPRMPRLRYFGSEYLVFIHSYGKDSQFFDLNAERLMQNVLNHRF